MAPLRPIPQPRHVELLAERRVVSRIEPVDVPREFATLASAIRTGVARIVGPHRAPALPLHVEHAGLPPQGYELVVGPDGVRVLAADAAGALYGVRTLLDIWEQTRPSLPLGTVVDHPTFAERGVFVESIWSSALMDLEDWRQFIDRIAALRFNRLGLALYGCWDLRHDGDRAEFLMVPFRDLPQLRTPLRIRTYSPTTRKETIVEQLPRMFVDGLLPAVVAHARAAGVEVVPFFAGPGHSTIIPRALPELSAVDGDGHPTGYGYCVTQEAARTRLGDLVSALVEEHLRPNGLDRLCVQGDEYYPIRNIDPQDALREVTPCCQCGTCRDLDAGEQLLEYLLLVSEALHREGVKVLHWHDSLYREGVATRYGKLLDERALPRPTLLWWRYSEPLPTVRADGFATWVAPTPGQTGWLFHKDTTLNIEGMVRRGIGVASGVMAYHSPDPAAHRNIACVADLAWNWEGSGGAAGFKQRWAERVAPAESTTCAYAYALGDSVLGDAACMNHIVDHLLPYFSTSPHGAVRFPDDLLAPLGVASPAFTEALRQIRDTLDAAVAAMPDTAHLAGWPRPGLAWETALNRISRHIDLWLGLIAVTRGGRALDETATAREARRLRDAARALLDDLAATTPAYLYPVLAREHWYLVRDVRRVLTAMQEQPERRPGPRGAWHAWQF